MSEVPIPEEIIQNENIVESSGSKPATSPYKGELAKSLEAVRSQSRGWIEAHLEEFKDLSPTEKVKTFHSLTFQGADTVGLDTATHPIGDWRKNEVRYGDFVAPTATEVPRLMASLDEVVTLVKSDPRFGQAGREDIAQRLATFEYLYVLMAHPLFDGNGSAARNLYSSELYDAGVKKVYLPRGRQLAGAFKENNFGIPNIVAMVSEITISFDEHDAPPVERVRGAQSLYFLEIVDKNKRILAKFIGHGDLEWMQERDAGDKDLDDLDKLEEAILDVNRIFESTSKEEVQFPS